MKSLCESLLAGKVSKPSAKIAPDSKKELEQIIDEYIKEIKPRPGQEVDLNWIDISDVDDLSGLFEDTDYIPVIDKWKIDRVKEFNSMFAYNKYIIRSPLPVLQKKLFRDRCYAYMFSNCKSLKVAPELPATKLTPDCYWRMFEGCTSLTRAPELPAMKLAQGCYASMFNGCSSLKVAPELPAIKLAVDCYYAMFKNCDNLKTKAKMPTGVDLDGSTAQGMYARCLCENK